MFLWLPPPPYRSGAPQFRSSPHILSYNPAESAVLVCSNTTNAENAYYEIFPVPRNTDPSNPECEYMYSSGPEVVAVFQLQYTLILLPARISSLINSFFVFLASIQEIVAMLSLTAVCTLYLSSE